MQIESCVDKGKLKQEITKVFARGTVIAEQHSAVNAIPAEVRWFHADPMTGSRQEVDKSGTAASLPPSAREEYEALGQKVNPLNPQSQVPPSSYDDYIGAATEPEWQCLNGGGHSFWELPTQCKVAAAQKFSTAELRAALNPEKERGNANLIGQESGHGGNRQPPTLKNNSPVNPTATNKPQTNASTQGAVPAASNPDNEEETSGDTLTFFVRSERAKDDPLESNNAEFGLSDASVSGRQTQQPQTDKQLVRTGLDSFLKNDLGGDCAAALTALNVSSQKLLDTFDSVKFAPNKNKRPFSARTSLNPKGPSTITTRTGVSEFVNASSDGFLIHELVHAARKLGDSGVYNILAKAQSIGKISTLPGLPIRKNKKGKKRGNTKADYSMALDTFFNNACQKSQSTPDDDEEDDEE